MNMKNATEGTEIFVSDYEYIVIDEVHNLEAKLECIYHSVSYLDAKGRCGFR